MLFSLILKYFFYNKRRTFRAVGILAVGITIILGTNMLIGGFINEINDFSSIVQRANKTFVIYADDENTFEIIDENIIDQAMEILRHAFEIEYYLPMLEFPGQLNVNNYSYNYINMAVTNMSVLLENRFISVSTRDKNEDILISDAIDVRTRSLGINYRMNFNDQEIITNYSGWFDEFEVRNVDLYIPFTSELVPEQYKNKWNSVEFKIYDSADPTYVKGELAKIDNIVIQEKRSDRQFLLKSGEQITQILLILQYGMSVLLIMSINYVMISLVQDSKDDINIMKMVGLSKFGRWSIYQGQTILVGIFASILSIIVSVFSLTIILSLIASTSILPYTLILINSDIIFQSIIQAIGISFLAGLYPASKVIS